MARYFFPPNADIIIIKSVVSAERRVRVQLALDTGATLSQISLEVAGAIGP